MIAELGMYPFASVRWAWDALWEALRERVDWLPAELEHSGDVHARWDDPECVVNHVCGWPLARWHVEDQRVLGAFSITIPEAEGRREQRRQPLGVDQSAQRHCRRTRRVPGSRQVQLCPCREPPRTSV